MNNHQRRFMEHAIDLALRNATSGEGGPFGAVVVQEGEIIAEGRNLVTSTNDPTAHAEIVAIREACRKLGSFQLNGCEIYASCEPCPMCLGAIYWARPAALFYAGSREDAAAFGFDDSFIYAEISLPTEARSIPTVQCMHDESLEAFRAWERSQKKVRY